MEPNITLPSSSPETGGARAAESPLQSRTPEAPGVVEVAPRPEVPGANGGAAPKLPALPTLPAPQSPQTTPAPVIKDTNPLAASDEDVIEKEWVDKAKKIVAETKNDPYQQEKEISRLQADYLKKRYGKELKLSSD